MVPSLSGSKTMSHTWQCTPLIPAQRQADLCESQDSQEFVSEKLKPKQTQTNQPNKQNKTNPQPTNQPTPPKIQKTEKKNPKQTVTKTNEPFSVIWLCEAESPTWIRAACFCYLNNVPRGRTVRTETAESPVINGEYSALE